VKNKKSKTARLRAVLLFISFLRKDQMNGSVLYSTRFFFAACIYEIAKNGCGKEHDQTIDHRRDTHGAVADYR
jgi:hypothetical protein